VTKLAHVRLNFKDFA
jgi:seryl-tRNA synthetase